MNGKTDLRHIPVYVVVPPRTLLLDIAGPIEVLRKANLEQGRVSFDVTYIGPVHELNSSVGLVLSRIAPLPDEVPGGAIVMISGSADQPLEDASRCSSDDGAAEHSIVAWLVRVIRPGIRLMTICSGALLAARAGLLDGHECTTHHATIATLRKQAPLAKVRENRLFVRDGERLTSAGITAGIDLMLALVEAETNATVALAVARYLVVYLRRGGNDPQLSPWLTGRNHIHPAIHRAQDAIGADPAREWSVENLARFVGASPRNLSRLFNQCVGMGVTDYVNRIRIVRARELVVGTCLSIELVAEGCGYSSSRQFRRAWSRLEALSPTALRAGTTT